MASPRKDPYGAFNYKVTIVPDSGLEIRGAFAEVSGLGKEITYADYRDGTDPFNHVRKLPLQDKSSDVTLKRGLVGVTDLFEWLQQVSDGNPQARAQVTIALRDEANQDDVATWKLTNARPSKWTGPTLAAKGSSDVAMEELVLVCEDLSYT